MFSKLLLASVAAIGLLLAGPQKASAQVVYACTSPTGAIVVVAANANCPPPLGGTPWTKVTLSQTQGVLAGRAFKCAAGSVAANGNISFAPSQSGVSFGSSIGTTGTGPWTSFNLQPGVYLIHFSGGQGTPGDGLQIQAILSGNGQATWYDFGADAAIVGGDRLVSVSAANTTLTMNSNVAATFAPQCAFLIMQVATAAVLP